MIYVHVKTKRVSSHDGNGMPKFETINQSLSEVGFGKFLKYLPYQGYILDELRVVGAIDDKTGENVDYKVYQSSLEATIAKITTVEKTEAEKLAEEKKKNEDLLARMAAIEAKLNPEKPKADVLDEMPKEDEKKSPVLDSVDEQKTEDNGEDDISLLKAAYEAKYGKKPHHNLSEAKLRDALK